MKLDKRISFGLLLFIMACFMLVASALPVEGSGRPSPCNFATGIYCEDFSFDEEHDSFTASLKNGMGREMILSDAHLWSKDTPLECWQKEEELQISNGEQKTLVMECTPFEKKDTYGRFSFNLSYPFVNELNAMHSMMGEVYVSRQTLLSRLPIGKILTFLVYLLVIRGLWRQVMGKESRRERLSCLCWGIIGSLVVGGVVSWGLVVVSAPYEGIPVLLSIPITFVVLAVLFGLAPHLISHKVKRRSFYVGVLKYALALGMLHFFVLLVWYFEIFTPS